jgi:TorA maturation chaperone TorD
MLNRLHIYTLLSRLFRVEVDADLLNALKDGEILVSDGALSADLSEGIHLMKKYLNSSEASTLDLAKDYAKAFCGAGSTNKTSAYPFESVYTSADGILMQEARDDALRWYHRFGLGKSAEWHDCEDHLALELEFLTFLINEYLITIQLGNKDSVASLLRTQADFMRQHLINWVPRFVKDAIRYSNTDFYRGLASFTAAYLLQDFAALENILHESAELTV